MKKNTKRILSTLLCMLLLSLTISGCSGVTPDSVTSAFDKLSDAATPDDGGSSTPMPNGFDYNAVPAYDKAPWVSINNNVPFFDTDDYGTNSYETYADLDTLGRCGITIANIGYDIMPTEERGDISTVKPTGWIQNNYGDLVESGYLYNRCHLIGYQLTGENSNPSNLITGTRYLNIDGMLDFENEVAEYVRTTKNHVLYRVTPIFIDSELLARGVLMEAYSVEDSGKGVQFCAFAYNVQPGVHIDYTDGSNCLDEDYIPSDDKPAVSPSEHVYILNKSSKKYHKDENCKGVQSMSDSNKGYFTPTDEHPTPEGYEPCGICCK